jgi:hypothetical protein
MLTTFSYEIGAVFLLAALLMYATKSGFIAPSFPAGKVVPISLGLLLLGFGIYHFGPDLSAGWRSMFANATRMASPGQAPAVGARVPHPAVPAASHAKTAKQWAPHWKTIVVEDSVLPPTKPTPASANPVPASTSTEVPEQAYPIPSAKPSGAESTGGSRHDHGIKRAVKGVGRFLHVGRGKD